MAVVGASTGMFGAVWAQAELRKVLASAGARVVEGEIPVGFAATRIEERGRLLDDDLAARVEELLGGLVDAVERREQNSRPALTPS